MCFNLVYFWEHTKVFWLQSCCLCSSALMHSPSALGAPPGSGPLWMCYQKERGRPPNEVAKKEVNIVFGSQLGQLIAKSALWFSTDQNKLHVLYFQFFMSIFLMFVYFCSLLVRVFVQKSEQFIRICDQLCIFVSYLLCQITISALFQFIFL